jgi:hypothetical protein
MRRSIIFLTIALSFTLLTAVAALAQAQTYNSDKAEFTLDLPSQSWRLASQPDSINRHTEFINGERNDGYLQVHKEVVDAGVKASDLAQRDQDQKLHFLTGFVEGKQEKFAGKLNGVTISYEYTAGGKPMMGRIYYLEADNRTIYALRFTGLRDKLARIRNQTDAIARSFRLK